MFNNEDELVIKKIDLLKGIQQGIIQGEHEITATNDIGYTSWVIANLIVDGIIKEKSKRKKVNRLLNIFLDKNNVKL